MLRSNDLEDLSPVQLMQYGPSLKKRSDINSACRSGIKTIPATTGAIPTEPGNASPTSSGLRRLDSEDLLQRLLRLQAADPPENAPPLDLYRTETGEHGEIYIATNEYREWFHRNHPRAGSRSEVPRPTPSSPSEGQGKSPTLKPVAF